MNWEAVGAIKQPTKSAGTPTNSALRRSSNQLRAISPRYLPTFDFQEVDPSARTLAQPEDTYNLEVDHDHFARTPGHAVLVHNTDPYDVYEALEEIGRSLLR